MKPKTLFLIKVAVFSLSLFAIWQPVTDIYAAGLNSFTLLLNNRGNIVGRGLGRLIREMFIYLVPLISLVLATPGMTLRRRLYVIISGIFIFFLADLLLIEYVLVLRNGVITDANRSLIVSLYHSVKWVLPFLLWLAGCYRFLSSRPASQKAPISS